MKQVIQNLRTGALRVADVPEPQLRPGHLLVRTSASLISAGTERMVVDFANKTLLGKAQSRPDLVRKVLDKARRDGLAATMRTVLARLDEPLPLGYSAAGQVAAIGAGLEGSYRVGQRVAIAGAGMANHAEVNLVPQSLVAPVPDDVPDEAAAFGTLGAIALHSVRNLGLGLGDVVAVVGVGLVGLLAVQLLVLSGARVVALDVDPGRLELARRVGAEWAFPISDESTRSIFAATDGRGVDGVLIAAASESSEPFALAAEVARDRARVVLVGKIGTEFPFADFMKKELSVIVSRSYGPGRYDDEFELGGTKYPIGFVRWTETENLRECLRLMSAANVRRLAVDELITHRFDLAQAETAYDLVLNGLEPHLGVVLRYPAEERTRAPEAPPAPRPASACVIGVVGAGAYANSVLLPELRKIPGAELRTVVTSRGMTAEHARARHGFAHAATDTEAIFGDPNINLVLVLTPPESHADLAVRALVAGKAAFVEKPLALTKDELSQIVSARRTAARFLMVGFNRRFAPFVREAVRHLRGLAGAKFVVIRVNAGPPPDADSRVLGEMCHFVDLARHLVGAAIRTVQATAAASRAGTGDDVTASLSFADGSIATIAYTGLGDTSFPKELIEIYAAGTIVRIDDFRTMTVAARGRSATQRSRLGQDKGQRDQMQALVAALRSGVPPIEEAELFETSLATIALLDSLQTGRRIDL